MRPSRLAASILLAFMLLGAASTAHAAEAFLGKWKLSKVFDKDGKPAPMKELEGGGMAWYFKPKGVALLRIWKGEDITEVKTIWEAKGDQLTTYEDDNANTVTWKVKGKTLSLTKAGHTLVFTRRK